MRIKSLKISNFRSIGEPLEIEFSNVCALIGPNNTGKSNILRAIYKVLGRDWVTVNNFEESDVFLNEPDRDISIEVVFEEPYEHVVYASTPPAQIPKIRFDYTKFKIGPQKGDRRLEKKCLTLDDRPVNILAAKPKKGEAHKYKPLTTIPQELQEAIPVIYIDTDRNLKYQVPGAKYSLLGKLLDEIHDDFLKDENTIPEDGTSGEPVMMPRKSVFKKRIAEAINALRTNQFLELEETIKRNVLNQLGLEADPDQPPVNVYFSPLESLEFYKSLEIWVEENGHSTNARNLGAGFQNAILISILRAFEERRKKGAIFLIEEPEMFLHPQMQRSLYKTLRKLAETNQVIYATHSPHFVTVPEFDEIRLVGKTAVGTKVQSSSLIPHENIDKIKERFRKELDPERNELFFAKRVLVVEGHTEKMALPEYAKRLNKDLDRSGTTIVEVGGKRNLVDFVELALSFKLPVAVAYDTDSSEFKDRRDEEAQLNSKLEAYAEKNVSVFKFDRNYEAELKKAFGDATYKTACMKYEKMSKPIRARLFAADHKLDVPEFIKPIIEWASSI